jgi:hypothetical protein
MTDRSHYVTVIAEHKHATRLVVAAREGANVIHTPLTAQRGEWEAARKEAKQHYPRRKVIVLALGETIPPPPRRRPTRKESE